MSYYLYRHVRIDTNVPFYIGIGKIRKYFNCIKIETLYRRAFSNKFRSKTWNYIINKTDYRIEILYETEDIKHIRNKEIEFI